MRDGSYFNSGEALEDFTDKVVLVTGASSGIGAALAKGFGGRGARVALTARREEGLRRTAEGLPGESLQLPADLLEPRHREQVVRKTLGRWGRIDILVNNAGLGMYGDFLDVTEEVWRRVFEINLFAAVEMTRAVLPSMLERGEGLVLNIASIGGLLAHADRVTAYVSSKHALVGFSRGLRKDLEHTGVRVLCACPHLTDTGFFEASPGAREMGPEIEKYRAFMDRPEDVAGGILAQLDAGGLILFPTEKPRRAYEGHRDL